MALNSQTNIVVLSTRILEKCWWKDPKFVRKWDVDASGIHQIHHWAAICLNCGPEHQMKAWWSWCRRSCQTYHMLRMFLFSNIYHRCLRIHVMVWVMLCGSVLSSPVVCNTSHPKSWYVHWNCFWEECKVTWLQTCETSFSAVEHVEKLRSTNHISAHYLVEQLLLLILFV